MTIKDFKIEAWKKGTTLTQLYKIAGKTQQYYSRELRVDNKTRREKAIKELKEALKKI